ncbi:uncharacterized protein [Aegilops tauschii subsp. strangulata]
MGKFRRFVDSNGLKELFLHGRAFTWSNERENPTLTKIDRVFVSVDWELDHPDGLLQALSTAISDHLVEAWTCDPNISDPFLRLDVLLRKTAHDLTAWGLRKIGNVKLQIAMANWIILQLDRAMDHRTLSAEERWLRNTLKLTSLGLASLERTIARQRSRIRWLGEGDANTKLFHLVANGRKLRNFIPALQLEDSVITDQNGKEEAFYNAYKELLGTYQAREHTIDLDFLGITPLDLQELDAIYTEEEVYSNP